MTMGARAEGSHLDGRFAAASGVGKARDLLLTRSAHSSLYWFSLILHSSPNLVTYSHHFQGTPLSFASLNTHSWRRFSCSSSSRRINGAAGITSHGIFTLTCTLPGMTDLLLQSTVRSCARGLPCAGDHCLAHCSGRAGRSITPHLQTSTEMEEGHIWEDRRVSLCGAAHLHDVPSRVSGLQIAVGVGGAVAAVVDALALALVALAVGLRADPHDVVRREPRPVALQLPRHRHKLLQPESS